MQQSTFRFVERLSGSTGSVPLLSVLAFAAACTSSSTPAESPNMESPDPGNPEARTPETNASEENQAEYPSELIEGEPMFTVLPPDSIPSIDDPVFVSIVEASEFMLPEEPVMGIIGADGTAKCYSAWHLEEHEIVNDQLDGSAIAVTW